MTKRARGRAAAAIAIILLMAFFLQGCRTIRIKESIMPLDSLIFGFIEFEGLALTEFNLKQIAPYNSTLIKFSLEKGIFYCQDIGPGSYRLENIQAEFGHPLLYLLFGFPYSHYTVRFPLQGNGIKIETRGIYYLGSYKLHYDADGKNIVMDRLEDPDEEKILSAMAQFTDPKCYFGKKIANRLWQLRRMSLPPELMP